MPSYGFPTLQNLRPRPTSNPVKSPKLVEIESPERNTSRLLTNGVFLSLRID